MTPDGMQHAGALTLALRATFAALLVAASVHDVRARRIPNAITGALTLLGLLAALLGAASGGIGIALLALLTGFAVWLPFHLVGLLGAGDVKLFAAAAAWLTPLAALHAAAASALVGGLLGLTWMVWARGAGFTLTRLAHASRQPQLLREPMPALAGRDARVPYGVAMTVALLWEAFGRWSAR